MNLYSVSYWLKGLIAAKVFLTGRSLLIHQAEFEPTHDTLILSLQIMVNETASEIFETTFEILTREKRVLLKLHIRT